MNIVSISNFRLWELDEQGIDLDKWLQTEIGSGNWKERFALTLKPYRMFDFVKEEDATMFALKWL